MKYRNVKDGYIVRLDKGEELVGVLTDFAEENGIESGFLTGLGGVQEATIGYYELEEKQYHFTDFDDLVEIVSLNGNFARNENKTFLHIHGAFSNRDLEVVGGHIQSAIVAGTCEVHITTFQEKIERKPNADIGLDLLDV